jgi:hypothetical protein
VKNNIAAVAKEFFVPLQRLRARWNGHKSKQDLIPGNRKLLEYQELAVCSHLNHLDKIGLPARLFMIANCVNSILRGDCEGEDPPPKVGQHWARRFLEQPPEYFIRK